MSLELMNRSKETNENQQSDSEKVRNIQNMYPDINKLGEISIINGIPTLNISIISKIPSIKKIEFGKQENLQTNDSIPHREEIYEINGLVIKEYQIQDNDEFANNKQLSDDGYPVLAPIALIKSEKGKLYLVEQKGINFKAYEESIISSEERRISKQLFDNFINKWIKLKKVPEQFDINELDKHLMVLDEYGKKVLKLIDVENVVNVSEDDIEILEKIKNEYLKPAEKSEEEKKTEISIYSHDVLNLLQPIKICLPFFLKQLPKEKFDEFKFHFDESIMKIKNKFEGLEDFFEKIESMNILNQENQEFIDYKNDLKNTFNELVSDLKNIKIENISRSSILNINKKIDDLKEKFRKKELYM